MKNLKKYANLILLTFILSSFILAPFGNPLKIKIINASNQTYLDSIKDQIKNKANLINSQDLTPDATLTNKFNINNFEEMALNLDKNGNGINDQFDYKLEPSKKSNSGANEQISFIIQFPDNNDYSKPLSFFKNNGGTINYKYKEAINGFSGNISYANFFLFCEQLRLNNIAFFIEEDVKVSTNLYYVSRNMNLRPYVWNTLGYDGDNSSSIAVLDTGIDESHEFFDNYTFGDFDYKIIGWRDFTTGGDNDTVSDYDGHGSHTAGIAAGMGTPVKSGLNRSIATHAENHDYSSSDYAEGTEDVVYFSRFEVSSLGEIEIECQFNDSTPAPDFTIADFYLVRDNIIVEEIDTFFSGDWINNMTYTIDSNDKFGEYFVATIVSFGDGNADTNCTDANFTVRAEVHWPFSPNTYGSGNIWKGVAPDTHLVAVKVIPGGTAEMIAAIDWVIANRTDLNITVMSMSLGLVDNDGDPVSHAGVISAVNNAVENGIVTVVSAGNDRNKYTYLSSPADADNVITVAATNINDQIAYYSSQGTTAGNTIKPDITAPGGSGMVNGIQIFSADTNDNDAEGHYPDAYSDDLYGAQGTSMACPAVAGAANLLIEAMGGANKWNWASGSKSKLVKSLLLMTATETYPLKREGIPTYSPTLDRGGKDIHEGYGRINIDAAIEAWEVDWTTNITNSELLTANLDTSYNNSYAKHAKAGFINLIQGQWYIFNLSVPAGADYDFYLYNSTPDVYGEPDLINWSTSALKGQDEILNYTADYTGKYFLVIKAIGEAILGRDDDDDDDDVKKEDLFWFYLFIIISVILIISIVALIIIVTHSRKKSDYTYIDY